MNGISKSPKVFLTILLIATSLVLPASAGQTTTIIGGSGRPLVEVNIDAIYKNRHDSNRNLRHAQEEIDRRIELKFPGKIDRSDSSDFNNLEKLRKNQNTSHKGSTVSILKKRSLAPNNVIRLKSENTHKKNGALSLVRKTDQPAIEKKSKKVTQKSDIVAPKLTPKYTSLELDAQTKKIDKPKKLAAVRTDTSSEKQEFRMLFKPSETSFEKKYQAQLLSLANKAVKFGNRVQIKAFASTSGNRPSHARRMSLSRALTVRSHLIQQGVLSTHIDVRALGEPNDGSAPDRVDVVLLPQ